MNPPYKPYSSTNPKSFGRYFDVYHKNKNKNPFANEDHNILSNLHVNTREGKHLRDHTSPLTKEKN